MGIEQKEKTITTPIPSCESYGVPDGYHGRMNLQARPPADLPRANAGHSRQGKNKLLAGAGCQVLLVPHRDVELRVMAQIPGA